MRPVDLAQLLVDLRPRPTGIGPVESDAGGPPLKLFGAFQGRESRCDAGERAWIFPLLPFCGLQRFPAGALPFAAEDMGVAPDHLVADRVDDVGWEALKAAEREHREDSSAVAGVAAALPALKRAEKLQRRAARVGFDWPDAHGPREKIDEELGEIDRAEGEAEMASEVGDLLFSVVNYARHLGIDPEAALRGANRRFEGRFRKVEALADRPLTDMDIEELEEIWRQAKKSLQASER